MPPTLLLGPALLALIVVADIIRPRRDSFFFMWLCQAMLYLFIAPWLDRDISTGSLPANYGTIQSLLVFFFLIPVIAAYLRCAGVRTRPKRGFTGYTVSPVRARLFCIFSVALTMAFVTVCLKNSLFYFWYGNEENLRRLQDLSLIDFAIYRTYVLSGLFLSAVWLFLLVETRGGRLVLPSAARWALALCFGVSFLRVAVNSRLSLGLLLATTYILFLGVTPRRETRKNGVLSLRMVAVAAVILVLFIHGLATVLAARVLVASQRNLDWTIMLYPYSYLEGPEEVSSYGYGHRLNGIDVIARAEAEMSSGHASLAYGELWRVPLFVVLGQFVAPREVEVYKTTYLASPKKGMLMWFTNLTENDYPTCVLTDVYGNFGMSGIAVCGVMFGIVFGVGRRLLAAGTGKAIVLGLFLITNCLQFEAEFLFVAVGWVRSLPVLVAVAMLWPVTDSQWCSAGGKWPLRPVRSASTLAPFGLSPGIVRTPVSSASQDAPVG